MRAHSFRFRPAFTLVELLVVIGIIAVLIGILLPSLSAARRQAQITQCLSIQREIASAAGIHAANHKGFYPLAGDFAIPYDSRGSPPQLVGDATQQRYSYTTWQMGGLGGTTLSVWHAAVAQYLGKRSALDGGSLGEQIDQETGLIGYLKYFICPSHHHNAADLPNGLAYNSPTMGWMVQQSYIINEAVFGFNDDFGRLRGNAARVRRPAVTMMISDGLPGEARGHGLSPDMGWVTWTNKVAQPPITLADALAGNKKAGDKKSFDLLRHRGKINVAFFDGHAETLRINPDELRRAYLLAE